MRCGTWQKKLSCYVDDALSEGDRRSVKAHVASCEACRAALKRFLLIRKAFAGRPAVVPSPHFYERMNSRMRTEEVEPPPWPDWRTFGRMAVAALLLIAIGGLSAYWMGQEGEPAAYGIVSRYLEQATGDDAPEIAVLYRSEVSRDAILKVAIHRK